MTTLTYLHRHVIPSAYALLPQTMQRPEATAMLIAIALQESHCEHRAQILSDGDKGAGRSFFQFEPSGVMGLTTHRASAPYLRLACATLKVTPMPSSIYAAIEYNDTLAAVCARLLLWTLPEALPEKGEVEAGWQQYLDAWRPGRPRPSMWRANYQAAWSVAES